MIIGTVRSMRVLRRASTPENPAATLTVDPPLILVLKAYHRLRGPAQMKFELAAKSETRASCRAGYSAGR
jgi:hypothetical protein